MVNKASINRTIVLSSYCQPSVTRSFYLGASDNFRPYDCALHHISIVAECTTPISRLRTAAMTVTHDQQGSRRAGSHSSRQSACMSPCISSFDKTSRHMTSRVQQLCWSRICKFSTSSLRQTNLYEIPLCMGDLIIASRSSSYATNNAFYISY